MTRRLRLPPALNTAFGGGWLPGATRGYKFVKDEHARTMLERGIVRIGRLSEYRDIESVSLRDNREGVNAIRGASRASYDDLSENSLARKLIKNSSLGIQLNIILEEGGALEWRFDFPVFCFSYEYGDEAGASLCDASNAYTACIEISDTFRFAEIVAEHLEHSVCRPVRYLCLPVQYSDTERTLHNESPDNLLVAFEKPSRFAPNREGRIVFALPDHPSEFRIWEGPDQPFSGIVEIPALKSLFRRIK